MTAETPLCDKLSIVAEFMELKFTEWKGNLIILRDGDFDIEDPDFYHPNSNYNQLMPAWRKFDNLSLLSLSYHEHCLAIEKAILQEPIQTAFDALYDAIIWLTSLTQNKEK